MEFLEVVTPPAIYRGCSTRRKFSEEKFIPVNMKICGRHNVTKYRDIKNGYRYIALDISSKLDSMNKREVIYSESRDYIGRSSDGLTIFMPLSTKIPNKKQYAMFVITRITDQYFRKLLKEIKNIPDLGYKSKQAHNKPTEAYLFLITQSSMIIKSC